MRIALTANGPGEVAGWVRPLLRALYRKAPDTEAYFRFDTLIQGNSNKGHDYLWAYDDSRRNADDLTALLAYLKTL